MVGIHAAMGGGTGMNRFEQRFPERTFDVGIAEQVRACATILGSSRRRPPFLGSQCAHEAVSTLLQTCCLLYCLSVTVTGCRLMAVRHLDPSAVGLLSSC